MKRTAIYMRVSTTRQAEEGDSIPAQRDALHKYINDHPDLIFSGEYLDDGISGTKLDRDEYQRLLSDIQSGSIDLVICTKLDRLHRGLRNFLNMQDVMEKSGCNWLAIWESMYDSSTPQGKMIINTMVNLAQFEAENTGQRIRQVFDYKRKQGEVTNGKIPYGYKVESKHLVPDEETSKNAVAIFEYFAKTGTVNDTMRYAFGLGYTATRMALKNMLSNPVYIGRRNGIDGFCQPIIDRDLWEQVQRGLDRSIRNNAKRTYVFAGLIVCAECGHRMTSSTRPGRTGTPYILYRCQKKYNRVIATCGNTRTLYETTLENMLLDRIPDMITEKQRQVRKEAESSPDPSKRIAALKRKIDRLKELYLAEEIGLEEYRADKANYMAEIAELEKERSSKHDNYDHILTLFVPDLKDRYQTWEKEDRRHFWRQIIKEIRFDKDRNITVEFL